jgi:hypothetical protein
MCAIHGSLTIIMSILNEARFSLESKKSDPVQGVASCAYFCFFDYVVGSGFDHVGTPFTWIHSARQRFYFNDKGLLQRLDYATDVAGGVASHYCFDHVTFIQFAFLAFLLVKPSSPCLFVRQDSGPDSPEKILSTRVAPFSTRACIGCRRCRWLVHRRRARRSICV